ncbi:DUF4905 domain-containing protein [Mucilaginibacter sp. ZB1P21]|uniref:DUF4905 domain-containing protein n=2 Tax=Mucilaginibacter glaciei TaxID=2772109 RepID=A0A926NTT2_9SPHI|nr:DUF4905 domain-containing protein [Mucilaginibacter glaciei]
MLQPFISHSLNGTIWRLEIDELNSTLMAEVRNVQDKLTTFTAIGLQTGNIHFTGYKTQERWLTGIEAVYNNVLLLHHYKNDTGPEHQGVIAINATTSANIWSNYAIAFDHMSINGPVIYQTAFQNKKLLLLDIHTGDVKRPFDVLQDKPLPNNIVIPGITTADQMPAGIVPANAFGNMVHYHNHNNYRIVSLHTQKKGVLQHHLLIMQGTNIVYRDLLNTDIQKLQPEAFVLHKNALIYIKNKAEIKVLNL